jgi:hypothetical protein
MELIEVRKLLSFWRPAFNSIYVLRWIFAQLKESIHQFRIFGGTEPCPDHSSLVVNSAHELHLLSSLAIVLLVNAKGIDP